MVSMYCHHLYIQLMLRLYIMVANFTALQLFTAYTFDTQVAIISIHMNCVLLH